MSKQLTREEALALMAQAQAAFPDLGKQPSGVTTVTRNKSGGIFIRVPDVKLWSEKKGKEYVGGINLDMKLAKEIFTNPSKLQLIQAFIKAEVAKESKEPEQTEQTAS